MADPGACHNPLPASKDKFAEKALIDSSNIPVISYALIPALPQALTPAVDPPNLYTSDDVQKTTKLALELFVRGQEHGKFQTNFAPRDRPLKAKNSNFCYKH